MKSIAFAGFAALLLCACEYQVQDDHLTGSGKLRSETRPAGKFLAIDNASIFNIEVVGGAAESIEVSGDDNLLAEVETSIEGDTLFVRNRKHKNGIRFSWRLSPVTVKIGVSQLNKIISSGSGDISAHNLQGETLEVRSSGSGDIQAGGKVKNLHIDASGRGDLDLQQMQAENLKLSMSGSGDAKLYGVAHALEANLDGRGDLQIDDARVALARLVMNGSGSIVLHGQIKALEADLSGSGDLDADGLNAETATLRMHGSGNASLAGTAGKLDAQLSGSGDLRAADLVSQHASVKVTGSGDAEVNVRQNSGAHVIKIDRDGVVH